MADVEVTVERDINGRPLPRPLIALAMTVTQADLERIQAVRARCWLSSIEGRRIPR